MCTRESALQQVSVPHQLQHDCQQLMFLTFFYSKAYFHQHHLSQQTNPAIFRLLGSCSPGYIIIHTPICVENTTQQYESDPSGRLCYLTTYIGLTTDVTLCLPPVIRYLPNLLNMKIMMMTSIAIVIEIKFRKITRIGWVLAPCSVLFAKWNFLFEYSI